MASIRRPMSADTKAQYDRIKQRQNQNAQTPSKTPGLPKSSEQKEQLQVQRLMKAKVTKDFGQLTTSSDSENCLRKALAEDALRKWNSEGPHERVREINSSSPDRRRPGSAPGVDEATPEHAGSAEPSRDAATTSNLKESIFGIRKVSRDRTLEQVNGGRDFTLGVNEYHIVESQVRPPHRRSPRKRSSGLPTFEDDTGIKQGQGDHRESFALEQRLAKLPRRVKTPLKTYAQNRTINGSQGGRVTLGEQPVEDNGGDEDAERGSQEDDEDIDEIDIEILHLGKEKLVTTPSRRNANDTVSPRSPKRPRDVPKPQPVDCDDNFSPIPSHWDNEDFEQPASKKRRQSSRQIPTVVVRNATIQKLKGQRESKPARNDQGDTGGRIAKAKGPKSSQKKAPRTLPVNELVTASERNDDSDDEDDIVKPMEVSEDPILLSSEDEAGVSKGRDRKSKTKVSIKWRPGQGFGPIDVSEFRMPQSQPVSANSKQPTYSDGFVGKEAEPIGRLMPIRQSNRRQSPTQRITVRMGQLTLVAETYSEDDDQEADIHQRRRRKSQRSATLPKAGAHGDEEDMMLIDSVELHPYDTHGQDMDEPILHETKIEGTHESKFLQQNQCDSGIPFQQIEDQERLLEAYVSGQMDEEGLNEPMVIDSIELGGAQSHRAEHVDHQDDEEAELMPRNVEAEQLGSSQSLQPFSVHERDSPITVKIPSPILRTPANRKSCLKRQPSTNRRVSFAGIDPSQQEVARNATQRGSKATSLPVFSQQLKDVSASRTTPRACSQDQLDVYHQLSMVKAPRRRSPDTESDDESDKSVSEDESEEEQSEKEESSCDERELTPAGSSEEGETDEPEEEILDRVAVDEAVQQEPSDDEDMPDQIVVDGGHTELKLPQVVIHAQKPAQHSVPAQSQGIQPDLQQIAREAQDIFESGNTTQTRSENENVSLHSTSPDGSWRPTQIVEPSSSSVLSESIQPSATCEQIEQIEAAIQAAPIRLEPKSNQIVEDDISLDLQNPDSTWRPQPPVSTGKPIEVAEDIIDTSPTPIPARQRASSQRRSLSQRQQVQSRRHSQPLRLVQSRLSPDLENQIATAGPHVESLVDSGGAELQQNTGLDSQGSIKLGRDQTFGHYRSKVKDVDSQGSTILGGSQPLLVRANDHLVPNISKKRGDSQLSNNSSGLAIPETQYEVEPEPDIRKSQQSYVPEPVSYFSRASQQLKEPVGPVKLSRTKSTPARTRMSFFGPGNEDPELMAGGITMEEAFAYSPSKTSPVRPSSFRTPARLPTLLEEKSSGQKSLRTLTRQAS